MIRYTPAKNGETKLNKNGETEYITFPALERYPELVCAFSTRKGGVSSGMYIRDGGALRLTYPKKR